KIIEQLWEPVVWPPANKEALLAKLDSLVPFHETPLVRCMVEAKKDLLRKDDDGKEITGFKTMVVVTDGMDTSFLKRQIGKVKSPGDPKYNPDGAKYATIPPFLEEQFKDSKIAIKI